MDINWGLSLKPRFNRPYSWRPITIGILFFAESAPDNIVQSKPQARQESLKIKINFLDIKVQHSHYDVSIFLNYFTNSYHNTYHTYRVCLY